MTWTKAHNKIKMVLSMASRNAFPLWNPTKGLLTEFEYFPTVIKGTPKFSTQFDTIKEKIDGLKKFKPPPKIRPIPPVYSEANYGDLKSKFRWELKGHFPERGQLLEAELFKLCERLHLVGWMKVRTSFAEGHFQGDPIALKAIQKFLTHKLSRNLGNRIYSAHIFDENQGIPEYEYRQMQCVKDWRTFVKRIDHARGQLRNRALNNLKTRTAQQYFEKGPRKMDLT